MSTPTRSLTLSIVPIDISTPTPSASQIGMSDFVSNVTPTSLSLARNYDSFYLNPDLESLLNTRGFSTKRPEIIGMFNYEAPLSSVNDAHGQTSEFLINPSGELYDMQCQLKQLRYEDANSFFTSRVALAGDGSGSFKITADANTTREQVELAKSLATQFETNRETTLSVLDYLTSIYNAVTKFIDKQNLNRRFNVFTESATASSPIDDMIFSNLPLMDTSLISSYVWNSDPMNLEYFIRIFAGDAITGGAGNGMRSPESYSVESTQVYGDSNSSRLVSGTWSMLTLLNIVMGGLKGFSSPYEIAERSSSEYDKINDFGTKLPGYLRFSTTVPLILPFNFEYEGDIGNHTLRVGGSPYGAESLNSVFSNTLKARLYGPTYETRTGGLAKLAYFIGLDTLQGAQLWRYDQASSNTKIAGVRVGSVKTKDYIFDLGDLIDQSIGRDTSFTLENILTDLPAGSGNFTRRLLTPNEDTDGGDDRGAVESFTSSNFLLATGVENSRNGRSYYCDEVVTKEISETTQRLANLRSGFQESGVNLSTITSLMFKRQIALRYNGDDFIKYGHSSASKRYSIPGDIVTHLVKEIAESYKWADTQEASWKSEISGQNCIWYLVAAASATDNDVFHKIVMLNLAWCEYQKANISTSILQDLADEIIDYVLDLSCDMIRDDYAERDRGDGHWALFDNGVAAPDGDISRGNIEDHSSGGGTSSSYMYYPSTSSGLQLEREDGVTTSFDDVMKKGSVTREDLKSKLKRSIFTNSSKNPLLAPVRSLRLFEHDLIDEPDRTGTSSDSRSYPYGFTARGYDFSSKITGLCFLWREFISKSLSSGLYIQKIRTTSRSGGDSKHDYSISSTWFYSLIVLNKRGLMSFINFADLWTGEYSSEIIKSVDPYTLTTPDPDVIGGGDVPMSDLSDFKSVDNYADSDQKYGYYQTFINLWSLYVAIVKDFQNREVNFIQSLRFMGQAFDGLNSAATGLQQVIQDNNIDRGLYDKALEPIRSDPRYRSSALLSITRDQLALNRSLYDSFFVPNRQYSYLPASKAIMTTQSKNLAAFLKMPPLLDQPDNKRFIASIGIPSGMLESLRNRMMDSTGNIDYRHASIVEISIWKRDLLRESVLYRPKRYVFDTSRFLIHGRPVGTKSSSEYLDDSLTSHVNAINAFSESVFRKYTPNGNVYTVKGKAYESRFYSESEGVDTGIITYNHLVDYYLKLFMRLSTGIDTSEDIFPFLEGNVFFDSVDPPNQAFYEKLAEMARFMFVDIDSVETSLNYDRLLREIRRSLFMSSEKYRNRVLYPKIFERTFAILINPDTFELYTGSDRSLPEETETIGTDSSLYHQYYATIGLKPAFEDAESSRIMYNTDGGFFPQQG